MEDELEINLGPMGYELLTRHNTSLFSFLGESAILGPLKVYNHIFIHEQQTETQEEYAIYIFADNENYEEIRRHAARHNFPQHLNLTYVSEGDQYAFDITHGIDNGELVFPAEWDVDEEGKGVE